MEQISIKTLIENAKEGRVSRKSYIENLVHQLRDMPCEHLYERRKGCDGKIHFSYEHLDNILGTLGIPIKDSARFSFNDLLTYTEDYLDSISNSKSDTAFEIVDYYFELARDIDSYRVERRLQP